MPTEADTSKPSELDGSIKTDRDFRGKPRHVRLRISGLIVLCLFLIGYMSFVAPSFSRALCFAFASAAKAVIVAPADGAAVIAKQNGRLRVSNQPCYQPLPFGSGSASRPLTAYVLRIRGKGVVIDLSKGSLERTTPWARSRVVFALRRPQRGAELTVIGSRGDDHIVMSDGRLDLDGDGRVDVRWGGEMTIRIRGGPGNDEIKAVAGTKERMILFGGDGNDYLSGGGGNDVFAGGPGDDVIIGGPGSDRAIFTDAVGPVRVDLAAESATGMGNDVLKGIEFVTGSSYADYLAGDGANNAMNGGPGDDELHGLDGDDTLEGGPGADLLDGGAGSDWAAFRISTAGVMVNLDSKSANTGSEADVLRDIENVDGSSFSDTLIGDSAPNRLRGREGNDELKGVGMGDRLDGGSGRDRCLDGEYTVLCESKTGTG